MTGDEPNEARGTERPESSETARERSLQALHAIAQQAQPIQQPAVARRAAPGRRPGRRPRVWWLWAAAIILLPAAGASVALHFAPQPGRTIRATPTPAHPGVTLI